MGFATLGVNQQAVDGFGTNYPFIEAPAAALYLLGDLDLTYQDSGFVPPFCVTQMLGFATPDGRQDIVIVDGNHVTVLDTTTLDDAAVTSLAFGDNLLSLCWTASDMILRAVMRLAPPPWDAGVTWTNSITINAALDARTYQRRPDRVRSITVNGNTFTTGTIEFHEGYNVSISQPVDASVDGGRRAWGLTFAAVPGAGLGLAPGCNDVQTQILTINGQSPTAAGAFTLDSDDCYRLQRPASVLAMAPQRQLLLGAEGLTDEQAAAALQVYNNCDPCCTCADYMNTYAGIRRLYDQFAALGRQAEATRDLFQNNIDRWNTQKACRESQSLQLLLNPEPQNNLFLGASHCNSTSCCIVPLVLRLTFEYFSGGTATDSSDVALSCRETQRSGADTNNQDTQYQPVNNWPVLDSFFERADPSGLSTLRTRMNIPAAAGNDTMRVTLSAHMPPIFEQSTGNACAIPDPASITIPAEIAAIWAAIPPPYPVRALIQRVVPVASVVGGCTN